MKKVTKEIKNKNKKSQMDKLIILNDDTSKQRIIELRNEGQGRSWTEVASAFNAEMNTDYTSSALQNAYEQEMSLEIQIDGNKEKLFSDNIEMVKARYEKISATLDRYQDVVDKLVDECAELDGKDLLIKVDELFRVGKQIEITHKMVDKQISLLMSEMEKISIKASKNTKKGLTDSEAMSKFKKYLPEVLESLEIQGKLKIVDSDLLKRR